jgi:hypothetical protein
VKRGNVQGEYKVSLVGCYVQRASSMSQAMQRKPQVRHDPSERGLTPARSQIMRAVVGRIGMALHEETVIDNRYGRFNNHNFAGYHVPVNADVYDVEVIFVDAREPSPTQSFMRRACASTIFPSLSISCLGERLPASPTAPGGEPHPPKP